MRSRDEDGYGYDIVRRLRAAGLEDVGDASVHGTLRCLYSGGARPPTSCPPTRERTAQCYGINAQGLATLQTQGKTWSAFAAGDSSSPWGLPTRSW